MKGASDQSIHESNEVERMEAVKQDLVGTMCRTSSQDRHREQWRSKENYRTARIQAVEKICRVVGTREYLTNAG